MDHFSSHPKKKNIERIITQKDGSKNGLKLCALVNAQIACFKKIMCSNIYPKAKLRNKIAYMRSDLIYTFYAI